MKFKSLLALIGAVLLAGPAAAQLDLPDAPKKSGKEAGVDLGKRPRGDVAPGPKRIGADGAPDLGPRTGPAAGATPEAEIPAVAVPVGAAEAIFGHLATLSKPDDGLIDEASRSLASMGLEGYDACRAALERDEPAVLLAAAKTLLDGGAQTDRYMVLRRFERKLPSRAAAAAVALVGTLPAEEAVAELVTLCDHRQGTMRRSAADALAARDEGLTTSAMLKLAGSSRSDTRRMAYTMMAGIDRPELDEYLLLGLEDSTARVAWEAAKALARRIDGPKDPLAKDLLEATRLRDFDDRRGAFALLAMAEAEDRLGTPLLPFGEATSLLIQLRSGSPFVAASCAVSLAGLGFRAETEVNWLDLEVTNALVQSVAGDLYFPEFAIVRGPALRRLSQLTGRNFGDDGPRWREWWVGNAKEFRALRAVIPLEPGDHPGLEVRWFDPAEARSFRLLGSLASPDAEPFVGLTMRLVPDESARLYRVLEEAGLFSAERLPGLLGRPTGVEPRLEVRHGRYVKAFRFGFGTDTKWLDTVVEELDSLEAGAAWQLYPSREHGLSTGGREAFFRAEAPWWTAERSEPERARRLAELVIDHMGLLAPEDREGPLARLAELQAEHQLIRPEDFEPLAELLAEESFFGKRARDLLSLALAAGADPLLEGHLSVASAGSLIDLLFVGGDAMRYEPLSLVLARAPRSLQHEAARDPRPGIRAVAASVLAVEKPEVQADTHELLAALLADGELEVESAAVMAVSAAGLHQYRNEVFLRARVGNPLVRVAALRGVAQLGGSGALEILRTAVLENEPMVRVAAAEALADLADPESAMILTQMLAGGERGPFFSSARRGLQRIGEPAWDGLLVLARSRTSPARLEAALMLSEQGVPEVASILMTMLTEDPSLTVVARELAILTGRDFRGQPDPAGAWWSWSDRVEGGDSLD
ncbi:MAG: HEAT repeat domain-containing protein, partial [Planctomycetota bacterium]|nr:HEAT repeat domain-containing protein [Planctomycetota bacterium]